MMAESVMSPVTGGLLEVLHVRDIQVGNLLGMEMGW